MAPAPVVSCAAADVTARVNTAATSTTDTRECRRDERSRCVMVSRHPSADPHEFLLVCVVVGKDQSPRADECGVTHGAASARPELSLIDQALSDTNLVGPKSSGSLGIIHLDSGLGPDVWPIEDDMVTLRNWVRLMWMCVALTLI